MVSLVARLNAVILASQVLVGGCSYLLKDDANIAKAVALLLLPAFIGLLASFVCENKFVDRFGTLCVGLAYTALAFAAGKWSVEAFSIGVFFVVITAWTVARREDRFWSAFGWGLVAATPILGAVLGMCMIAFPDRARVSS